MNQVYLDTHEDMRWLRDVYGAPANIQCAILYGNEDAADKIEGWTVVNPNWDATPDWHYTADAE
jgi:hypothetical protein